MNKIEEKIKEAIMDNNDQSDFFDEDAIERRAKEKSQEILSDLTVSSPDQLEVWVDGREEGSFIGFYYDAEDHVQRIRSTAPKCIGIQEVGHSMEEHIKLITPDGVVVMDNRKDQDQ